VAPALSELAERYPRLDIRLDVHDRLVDLIAEGVDLDIRVATPSPPT
jgi:LysR family transcriptional activator of dmlA